MAIKSTFRLTELDLLRGIAILAVVLIHFTGPAIRQLSLTSYAYDFYLILNRLAQFAVPCFIFISAFALTYRNKTRKGLPSWGQFYRQRINRILIPYFLWSCFYILYRLINHEGNTIFLKKIIYWFVLGKSFYHLYFLILIIQLSLLLPLFLFFIPRQREKALLFFVLTWGIQLGIYWVNRLFVYAHFPYPATILLWYLPLVGLGLWLGWHIGDWQKLNLKVFWPLIPLVILSGYLYVQQSYSVFAGQKVNTFYYQILWYVYVTGLSLLLLLFCRFLAYQNLRLTRFLTALGLSSFGIYLIHPLILELWHRWIHFGQPLYFHLAFWTGYILVVGFSWWLTRLIERYPLMSKYLLGTKFL